MIGAFFSVSGVIYALLAPTTYLLTERLPKRIVIILGCLIMSVGMLFVGTSKTLGMENSPVAIMLGLMCLGAA